MNSCPILSQTKSPRWNIILFQPSRRGCLWILCLYSHGYGGRLWNLCRSCHSYRGHFWTFFFNSKPTKEAISELSSCSEPAMVAYCELFVHLVSTNVSDFEQSVLPVYVKESKPGLCLSKCCCWVWIWSRFILMLNHPSVQFVLMGLSKNCLSVHPGNQRNCGWVSALAQRVSKLWPSNGCQILLGFGCADLDWFAQRHGKFSHIRHDYGQ